MLFTEFNMEDALEIRGEEKFAEGLSTGEELFAHLAECLMKDQRQQDLLRATKDREFRNSLYREYEMESK